MSRGIDYGRGQTNIDKATGIRFGVISQNEVFQAWCDSSEGDYGPPTCGHCGNEIDEDDIPGDRFACPHCGKEIDAGMGELYGEEPLRHTYDGDGYACTQGSDGDIFILKSPYFTRAAFCSPCAPGACYLMNPCDDGERAYCFGHDWFEDGKAPYPVYSVATGEIVEA